MADAMDEMMGRMSPENREWVSKLSPERKRELMQNWQNSGGQTGIGNVGADPNTADADAMVEKMRNE